MERIGEASERDRLAARAVSGEDAPPISVCVTCGLTQCAGCMPPETAADSRLPWEDVRQHWLARLWSTALASSLEPRSFFGELPYGGITTALVFATCAEVFALGSLALLAGLGFWLVAPGLTHELLASASACFTLALLWALFVLSMLGLHALWGACLDVGTRGAGSYQRGIRFGLYACGWDLLTSPAGLLATLITRGPQRAWAPIGAAVRAPVLAQRAHLELCLGADGPAQRRARRLAMAAVGIGLLAILAIFSASILTLAHRFGY